MSYVDTFDHELVGFFAGLPLYHPLETVREVSPWEFGCSPTHLVLGGGDGEHPALVLTDPPASAMHFVQYVLAHDPELERSISGESLDLILNAPLSTECIRYAGWSLDTFAVFHERCMASAFLHPYKFEEPGWGLDEWLVSSLGEFVYFAMPELAASYLEAMQDVRKVVQAPALYNVLILPPGFQAPAGRRHDESGNVVFGNYRWITTKRTAASAGDSPAR
jgi:hypothetical protein